MDGSLLQCKQGTVDWSIDPLLVGAMEAQGKSMDPLGVETAEAQDKLMALSPC